MFYMSFYQLRLSAIQSRSDFLFFRRSSNALLLDIISNLFYRLLMSSKVFVLLLCHSDHLASSRNFSYIVLLDSLSQTTVGVSQQLLCKKKTGIRLVLIFFEVLFLLIQLILSFSAFLSASFSCAIFLTASSFCCCSRANLASSFFLVQ